MENTVFELHHNHCLLVRPLALLHCQLQAYLLFHASIGTGTDHATSSLNISVRHHLGTKACQAHHLLEFLKEYSSEHMFLLGDIVDLWSMSRGVYIGLPRRTPSCKRCCDAPGTVRK